ncbi:MAG: DUF4097 family beta strand repeat-containing protein [Bryobacteraceae bacterium]|jgi:hypothetical protein
MRRHSLTGPLLLLLIGGLFLWRNLHPETHIFGLVSLYWPFLLIAWGLMRLVEALIWSRQGYRLCFTGGEVALIVLICIAGSGIWQARRYGVHFNAGGLDLWGQQYGYPISASGPAAGIKRIVFENPRGNIKVTGGDSQEVQVMGRKLIRSYGHSEADRTNQNTPVELVPQGDALLVRTNQDRAPDNQRVSDDLEVTVPRGMAVEAHGSYGDYEIAGVAGDVHLATDHGDARLTGLGGGARLEIGHSDLIRAAGVKGAFDLQGEGSDIDLEDISGRVTINGAYRGSLEFKNLAQSLQLDGVRDTELRVQAAPGQIDMDLSQFSARDIVGPARLVTRSRDVKVERFTKSLDLETERGDVELTPGCLPLPSINARSASGRIDLALPPGAAFTLEATAEIGDAVTDFGPPIQKEVNGRTSKLTGKVGNGPNIRLTTNRGGISVRKEAILPSETAPPGKPAKGSEI